MTYLKESSVIVQRVREVEQILRDKGISIQIRSSSELEIVVNTGKEQEIPLIMRDEEVPLTVFPSDIEPSYLVPLEHYLLGE